MINWMVEKKVVKRGHEINAVPLTKIKEELDCYQHQAVANQDTFIAILNREDYTRVMRRLMADFSKKKIEFIKSIPYFSQLSTNQSQNLLRNALEINYVRNQ